MADQLKAVPFKRRAVKNVTNRFIGLGSGSFEQFPTGQHPVQALYWTPSDNRTPDVAIMFVHYNADFSEHILAGPLAEKGFGVLGFNTRFRGSEDTFVLETAIQDISVGVKWLRDEAHAKTVVFIGFSGGGSLFSAYQATAQKDPNMEAADLFIFCNAHPGRPDVLTKWLDPSVIDEFDPVATDESLNLYNPNNKPPFSKEWVEKYRAAQVARNDRITEWAKKELKRLNAAGIPDRHFALFRTMADPRFVDATLDPSTRECPACYAGDPATANKGTPLLGRTNTLKTWLSMWSLKESKCRLELYASQFTVPTLVVQTTADLGVFPSDAQAIYDSISSKDKEIHFLDGPHFLDRDQKELDAVVDTLTTWITKKTA